MSPNDCAALMAKMNPTMPGWCRQSKGQRLFELVIENRPVRSIELGVFGGRSFLSLALGHWSLGMGRAIGVDPWTVEAALEGTNAPANVEWWQAQDLKMIGANARAVIASLVPPEYFAFSEVKSLEHAADPLANPIKYGLMHQDSNHSEEISVAEFEAYRPMMQPGSLWVMDDIKWESLQAVQKKMTEDHGFVLEEFGPDWGVYRVPR